MTKKFFLLFAILFVSVPAIAQEAESIAPTRLELAGKMHEIWPIRTRIETALDAVSESFPPDRQAEVKAALRKSIQFDQVEEASIRAMAQTFTEEELAAMIEFYGSETGRSISAKTSSYEAVLRPIMVQMMDRAMLDLRTGQTAP